MRIFRRGSKYWLDLTIGDKRHRVSLGVDEYGLALDRAREKERELRSGKKPSAGASFEGFLKDYLEWAGLNKATTTIRTEEYRIRAIQEFFRKSGVSTFEDITPHQVEQLRAWVQSIERRRKKKDSHGNLIDPGKSSRATANRYCATLRTIINKAIDWDRFPGPSPFRKVRFYRESPKVRPLSDDDVGRIMAAAREISANHQSPAQRAAADFIRFLLMTGLRKSEALMLRKANVRETEADVVGKGDRKRTIPLNATSQAIIGRQSKRGEYVFEIPNREKPDLFRRTIWAIRKKSGVKDFHLHLTRHYFATSLQARGVDLITVASILGHSKLTTSLIYSHTDTGRKMTAVSSLDKKRRVTKSRHSPTDVSKKKKKKSRPSS